MTLWKRGGHPNVALSEEVYAVHANLSEISRDMEIRSRTPLFASQLCKDHHPALAASPELASLLLKAISTLRWMNSRAEGDSHEGSSPKYLLQVVQKKFQECSEAVFGTGRDTCESEALNRWCSVQLWPIKDQWGLSWNQSLWQTANCGSRFRYGSCITVVAK